MPFSATILSALTLLFASPALAQSMRHGMILPRNPVAPYVKYLPLIILAMIFYFVVIHKKKK